MREIGKLYRLEGVLMRGGRGLCLKREPDGILWMLKMKDDVPDLVGRQVRVEGIKCATAVLDVYWIAELTDQDCA